MHWISVRFYEITISVKKILKSIFTYTIIANILRKPKGKSIRTKETTTIGAALGRALQGRFAPLWLWFLFLGAQYLAHN